ncbi:HTH_48 domain-containing protein [Caerostris extrusa]|uniref:HTH_48 domain-containing protein n=1 Tax=Caerostris extrusa TaxID=172846 RepID=A0AAV4TSF6_CAEEX|nr:HTH_48 domain-containing protein [Caerostris extrusa]
MGSPYFNEENYNGSHFHLRLTLQMQRGDIFEASSDGIMLSRKRSWGKRNEPLLATPKADLLPTKKIMLYIWWDWKEILHYELLPNNETIYYEKNCSQLDVLKIAIEQKHSEITNRKVVMFHQDNMRPQMS